MRPQMKVCDQLGFAVLKQRHVGHSDGCKPSPGAAGHQQSTSSH